MEALILAGGRGERLGSLTNGSPKSLITVAGYPLIAYQVESLLRVGVQRVIVSCAEGTQELFLRALRPSGVDIICAAEPKPLGRGGAIRFAAEKRKEGGPAYVLNGDELTSLDLEALRSRHLTARPAATIALTPYRSAFGIIEVDNNFWIRKFVEGAELPYWVSIGVYIFDDEAFGRTPALGDHETLTFPDLADEGRLIGFPHRGDWFTVNTPKELRRAEESFVRNPGWLPMPTWAKGPN